MNILLVEDDTLVATMLLRILRRKGHTVHHVTGIAELSEYAASEAEPDLVVTDRDVIGGDAWNVVRAAVAAGLLPDNVIFMSGRIPNERPARFWLKGGEPTSTLLELVAKAERPNGDA